MPGPKSADAWSANETVVASECMLPGIDVRCAFCAWNAPDDLVSLEALDGGVLDLVDPSSSLLLEAR